MFEADLYERLTHLNIEAYPGSAPVGFTTPCATYSRIDTDPEDDLDGFTGFAALSMQISVFDPGYIVAKNLATTIRRNLETWPEHIVSWTFEADQIDRTYADAPLHQIVMRFLIFVDLDA